MTIVRLMLNLETLLDLKSKQGDVTAAFLHAELEEGEEVYVAMPQGFKKPGKVLKLRRTLYGLRQSPRAFWKYMVEKMEICGTIHVPSLSLLGEPSTWDDAWFEREC